MSKSFKYLEALNIIGIPMLQQPMSGAEARYLPIRVIVSQSLFGKTTTGFLFLFFFSIVFAATTTDKGDYFELCNSEKCFFIDKNFGAQYTEDFNNYWSENMLGLSFYCDYSDSKTKKEWFASDLVWSWENKDTNDGVANLLGKTSLKFRQYEYDLNALYVFSDGEIKLEINYSVMETASKTCADLNFLYRIDKISVAGATGKNAQLEYLKVWGFPEAKPLNEEFGYDWNKLGDRRFTWRNIATGQYMEDFWVSDGLKEGGWWEIEPSFEHNNKTLFSIKVGSLAANKGFSLSHLWFDANKAGYGYNLGSNFAPFLGNSYLPSNGFVLQTEPDYARKKLWVLANDLNGTPNLLLLQYNMDSNTVTNLTPLMKRPRCRDDYNAACASALPLVLQNRSWSMDFDGNNLWIGFRGTDAVFVYLPDLEQFYWLNKEFSEIELGAGGSGWGGPNNYVVDCGNTHCYLSASNDAAPQQTKFARIQKNFLQAGGFNHKYSIEDLNDFTGNSGQSPNWDANCNSTCKVWNILVEDTNHVVYIAGNIVGTSYPMLSMFFEDANRTVIVPDLNLIFRPNAAGKYREVNKLVFDGNANIYLLGSWDWGGVISGLRHFAQYDRNLLTLKDLNYQLQSRAAEKPTGIGSCLGSARGTENIQFMTGDFFPIKPNNIDGNIVIGGYSAGICNYDPILSAGMKAATKWGNDWTVMSESSNTVFDLDYSADQNIYFAGGLGGSIGFHTYSNSEIHPEWIDSNLGFAYAFQENSLRAAASCWKGWCGDTNFVLQWCKGSECESWKDLNADTTQELYYSSADANEDSYRFLLEDTTTTWHLVPQATGTFRLRYYNDSNNADANYSQAREIVVPSGGYFKITSFPQTERFQRKDKNTTYSYRIDCKLGNCGDTNIQIQYAYGLNSTQFYDLNTATTSLLRATNPTTINLLQDQSTDFNLNVWAQATNWYWLGKPKIEGSLAWDYNQTNTTLYRYSCNQECLEVSSNATDINITDGLRSWHYNTSTMWQPYLFYDYNIQYGLRQLAGNTETYTPQKFELFSAEGTHLSGFTHSLDENLSVRVKIRTSDGTGNTLISTIYPNGKIYQNFRFTATIQDLFDYYYFSDSNSASIYPDWNETISGFQKNKVWGYSDTSDTDSNNNYTGTGFIHYDLTEMGTIDPSTCYSSIWDAATPTFKAGGFYCGNTAGNPMQTKFRQLITAHHYRTSTSDLNSQGNDYREPATITTTVGTFTKWDENIGTYVLNATNNNVRLQLNTNQKKRFYPAFELTSYTTATKPTIYLDNNIQTENTDYIIDINTASDTAIIMFLKDLNANNMQIDFNDSLLRENLAASPPTIEETIDIETGIKTIQISITNNGTLPAYDTNIYNHCPEASASATKNTLNDINVSKTENFALSLLPTGTDGTINCRLTIESQLFSLNIPITIHDLAPTGNLPQPEKSFDAIIIQSTQPVLAIVGTETKLEARITNYLNQDILVSVRGEGDLKGLFRDFNLLVPANQTKFVIITLKVPLNSLNRLNGSIVFKDISSGANTQTSIPIILKTEQETEIDWIQVIGIAASVAIAGTLIWFKKRKAGVGGEASG